MIKTKELLDLLKERNEDGSLKDAWQQMQTMHGYLLENFENNDHDKALLNEVVFATRKEVINTIARQQKNKKLDDHEFVRYNYDNPEESEAHNATLSAFIDDPMGEVGKSFKNIADMLDNDIEESKAEVAPQLEKTKIYAKVKQKELELAEENLANAKTEEEKAVAQEKLAEAQQIMQSTNEIMAEYQAQLDEIDAQMNVDTNKIRVIGEVCESKVEKYNELVQNDAGALSDNINLLGDFNGYESDRPVIEYLDDSKGGFWERRLGRTSKEWKTFDKVMRERVDGKSAREEVDNAAKAYLMHKIPGYKGEGLPKREDIENLSGVGQRRAIIAYNTLIANQKSRDYEEKEADIAMQAKQNNFINESAKQEAEAKSDEVSIDIDNVMGKHDKLLEENPMMDTSISSKEPEPMDAYDKYHDKIEAVFDMIEKEQLDISKEDLEDSKQEINYDDIDVEENKAIDDISMEN